MNIFDPGYLTWSEYLTIFNLIAVIWLASLVDRIEKSLKIK
ncbi:MAG: hypothetical protein V1732_02925 [Patescibacteria group bacterium]